ncbi:MAG: PAS domain S-box protein [Myxacorys chilensis ATA2-1-KO14]|jgi:PAS domain S-box-containing protein|nr:PAS domain S-box protein [Myxacorys chilensis ATA2-1-KO14]
MQEDEQQKLQQQLQQRNAELENLVQTLKAQLQAASLPLATDSSGTTDEQDQAQKALQRLNFHVDNSPFAVIEWDLELRVTRWSREAEILLGWSAHEILGKRFGSWKFVVREDFKSVDPTLAALLSGQVTRNVCYNRNYTKTGEIVHCEWYNSVLFDESGELVSIMSLVLNVGDRKQAAEELRESEERFRQLAENIQQIFWMYDFEEQKLIYISPVCQQVIGYENERCYDKSLEFWLGHIRQDDLPQVMKASRQAVRGKPAEVTFRFTKPDGAERWLLARAFPVRNAAGRVYRIAGIAEDISDRKEQERRLRLLESVVVNANDAVVITEAEPVEPPGPKIVYINDAFTRMMGYRFEEVIGRTPRILQGPKTDWGELKHIRTALKKWEPALAELVNYHKDGSEVWIELSIFPVTDQTGHYTYWVGLQRDITQRKQAEVEMQKALDQERELSELKSRFVSTASHEFRTPLSTILSSADLLEFYLGNCTVEKQREHIERIQGAALNMNNLLSDVLVIERAEAKFEPTELDLHLFCQELVDEMRINDQDQHRFELYVQATGGKTQARMDNKLLRQILTNLLSNALKYSPIGTTVYLRLECDRTAAKFEVKDEGIGIPLEDQGHLFEPFHRGTNVGAVSGNGLGLAIVKQSVDAHGGQIAIASYEKGTTVCVTLPLQPKDYSNVE